MAPGMIIAKNSLDSTKWNIESGYANESENERNYPYQGINTGRKSSLYLMLRCSSRDIDHQCRGYNKGFQIFLTTPGETVDRSQNYLRMPISEQNIIKIGPKLTITSEGLRSYKPNQRQCFYNSEHPLRFFKMYTKANCNAECLANFTNIECGCVKFSMPSKKLSLHSHMIGI